ncbi:hypothetical protein [Paenibacillus sp. GYB003]|uniref:hypothetical protein n=1 Tax=Paenibacillus sp. GYB003 TaxID=2994392 RepID=UPI002F96A7B6
MGWLKRQQEMKLDILESLARSQRAMARIIESAADMNEGGASGAGDDKELRKSLEAIARYQLAIMEKMVGITIGEVCSSQPARPWTNEALRVAPLYGAGETQHQPEKHPRHEAT